MNKIRYGKDKGDLLFPEVLSGLKDYWAKEEDFQKRSAIGK